MQAELLVSTGRIRSSQDAEYRQPIATVFAPIRQWGRASPSASERVFGGMFLSFDARE